MYHGADLLRLGAALPALAQFIARRGLVSIPEVAASAGGAGTAAVIVLSWYGVGDVVLRAVGRQRPDRPDEPVLGLARATAFGAGTWSLAWLGLGLSGLYTVSTAVAAAVVGAVLGVVALARRRFRAAPAPAAPPGAPAWLARAALVLTAVPLAAAFIAALAPPTAKDALQYHIALPKAFVAAGRLVVVDHNIASFFPLGAEMNGVWAMLLGRGLGPRVGEAAFGAVAFAFFPLLLAVVYGWARACGVGRRWALVGAALVATVPTVYEVAGSGYVDLALAVYVALAVEAAARWWTTGERRHLVSLSLALGFAMSVKVLALVPVLLLTALVLLRALRPAGAAPSPRIAGATAVVAAMALGSPWYLRTWAHTGSPVFPFFLDLWPAQAAGWDTERSVMLRAFNAQYGAADPLSFLLAPIMVSITGWREVAALYEGVLGVAFLVGAPLVAAALHRRLLGPDLAVAAAVAALLFVWWTFSAQVLRYLLPALAPAAVAIAGAAAALSRGGSRGLGGVVLAPAAASALLAAAWFVADAPMLPVVGSEPRDEYLARRLDHYRYYRLVNATLPPDARVWLINMRRDTYHLERPYFSDYLFEDHTLRQWVARAATPADLRARARAAGLTHVLVRHDVLLDYARSPLVSDDRAREENLARLALVRAFLEDGARILAADAKFALTALPPAP